MLRLLRLVVPLLALAAGVVYGGWAYQKIRFPFDGTIPGLESAALRNTQVRFKPAGRPQGDGATATQLNELGYQDESARAAGGETGVVLHDSAAASAGWNLVVSGHAEEAVLTDMDGRVVHRWSYDLAAELPGDEASSLRARFRRAHLGSDGSLTAVYGGHAWLVKLDKDSQLVWKKQGGFHHDLDVRPDGRIYAIGSEAHVLERIHRKRPVIEDFLVVLSADGEELDRLSVLEAFENSDYAPMLGLMPAFGDILHTNTIEVLGEPHPSAPASWKAGQVLISIREMDTIAVVDLQERRVVWALTGLWDAQHQPTVLANGNLLVFDNYGTGMSRVLELEPASLRVVWDYRGDAENGFFSETCGSNQRLPNGNTLITESDNGRAFELTPAKKLVWRYLSPFRAGDDGGMVATLFEVVRIPPDHLEDGVLAAD